MSDPIIGTFDTLTLHVEDIDAAVEFYRDVLELELAQDMRDQDFALMKGGGLTLGLHKPFPGEGGREPGGVTGGIWSVPDIETTFKELRKRGVEIGDAPSEVPWGAIAGTFYDPSGNEWLVAQWLEG